MDKKLKIKPTHIHYNLQSCLHSYNLGQKCYCNCSLKQFFFFFKLTFFLKAKYNKKFLYENLLKFPFTTVTICINLDKS